MKKPMDSLGDITLVFSKFSVSFTNIGSVPGAVKAQTICNHLHPHGRPENPYWTEEMKALRNKATEVPRATPGLERRSPHSEPSPTTPNSCTSAGFSCLLGAVQLEGYCVLVAVL